MRVTFLSDGYRRWHRGFNITYFQLKGNLTHNMQGKIRLAAVVFALLYYFHYSKT